ncbi:MAG TPA: alkaline phosphatase D family protein [Myxococcota bacterium]|nr:alkaline phosphatase D family protein [Myxococcota bacterium]
MDRERRRFLRLALAAGVALPAAPLLAGCRATPRSGASEARTRFAHGVASGDPLADRVVLWTRVEPDGAGPLQVRWRVARDPDLRRVVAEGSASAGPERDFTVKVDARGLEPGATYYYGFECAGERSPLGRTRTLPVGACPRLRLAVTSCANVAFGWFTPYADLAERADLDAVLYLGDYLYEYQNGVYGDGTSLGRVPAPDRETLSLADYRARHAQYKADPDLQAVHRQHPAIAVWDDHEIANDAWQDGAQNHDPAGEGPYAARRSAAVRAWREWMPVREDDMPADPAARAPRIWRGFRFGDLADLLMLDTRLEGRARQAASPTDRAALADPSRSLLGAEQERWLFARLSGSRRDGVGWRLLGQQVLFSQIRTADGTIRNPDAWDGYPAARARVLDHLRRDGVQGVVVLTGDVHSSWALDVAPDPFDRAGYDPGNGRGALAVELVTPAVSSAAPGRDPADARAREAEWLRLLPHLRWLEFWHRGHLLLDVDRRRAQGEWWHVDGVERRGEPARFAAAFATRAGANHLEPVDAPSEPREDAPLLAP